MKMSDPKAESLLEAFRKKGLSVKPEWINKCLQVEEASASQEDRTKAHHELNKLIDDLLAAREIEPQE